MVPDNDNPNYKPVTGERRSRITNPTPYSGLGKLPPQAVDLEEAVLGALMLEKDALSSVIDILNPQVFYKDNHQKIFAAIRHLFERTSPVDILTVTAQLRQQGELEEDAPAQVVAHGVGDAQPEDPDDAAEDQRNGGRARRPTGAGRTPATATLAAGAAAASADRAGR